MKKTAKEIKNIVSLFQARPTIGLVYLFGSRAENRSGPLSDYDFAVYLDEADPAERFKERLELLDLLARNLKTNNIDLCILNDVRSPELKYHIVKEGQLIFEREPFKVLLEPRIFNEYFDFRQSLVRHHLTKTT